MTLIDPEELLLAYRLGIFPMAESRYSEDVLWIRPRERGVLPLETFHVPKRLARTLHRDRYQIRVDTAFDAVIRGCAAVGRGRGETWINEAIIDVFGRLFARGAVHSVEAYDDGALVGGVYGLSIGAVFFAESKFSRATDASKVALVHLAGRLKYGGYRLLDAQFPNPHLDQFGAVNISEERFEALLNTALTGSADFGALDRDYGVAGAGVAGTPRAGAAGAVPTGAAAGAGRAGAAAGAAGGVTGTGGGWAAGSSVLHVMTQTS